VARGRRYGSNCHPSTNVDVTCPTRAVSVSSRRLSTPPTELDALAFDRFVREEARRRIERITLVSVACFGTAWTIGRVAAGDAAMGAPGQRWLALMSGFALLGFVTFRYLPLAGRQPIAIAALFQMVLSAAAGLGLSGLGELGGPFIYAIFLLPPLAIGLPMGLRWRLVVTLVGPATFALVYLFAHPVNATSHLPIIVGTATSLVSVMLGHQVHLVGRDRFLAERELERHRDSLARETEELEREVRARSETLDELRRSLERAGVDRADVARALHDDLGQLIVRVRMELDMLETTLAHVPDEEGTSLGHLSSVVEMLDSSVRVFIDRLREPEPVGELGAALESIVAPLRSRSGMRIETSVDLSSPLTEPAREAVYRFVQETVTNVFKHAAATRVSIAVGDVDGEIQAELSDDGMGFEARLEGGLGLSGLRARAARLGGSLQVRSAPGEGATVRMCFPRSMSDEASG